MRSRCLNSIAVALVLMLSLFDLSGCAGSLAAPHGLNGTVAYGGSTLQAVEDTAAVEYPYMPVAQVKSVHALIKQAESIRDAAVQAAQSGDTSTANSKLQMLATVLGQIQATLHQYEVSHVAKP